MYTTLPIVLRCHLLILYLKYTNSRMRKKYSYRQCPLCVSQTISRQSVPHGQQIVVVGLCADSDMVQWLCIVVVIAVAQYPLL